MQKRNSDRETEDEIWEEKGIKCRAGEKSEKKIAGERERGESG